MGKLHCEAVSSLSGVKPYVAEWSQLCTRATEDNVYMSPEFMISVLRHFAHDGGFYVVFVLDTSREPRRLIGCAAFSLVPPSFRIPFWTLSTISSPYSYVNNPLLDRDQPADSVRVLWDWVEDQSHPWRMVLLRKIREDLPSWQYLERELGNRGRDFVVTERERRALLQRFPSFESYLASLPSSRRKQYRRCWRRLCRTGAVQVKLHQNLQQTADLSERFMALEASGWKGTSGSAMLVSEQSRAFLREVVNDLGRRDQLFAVELLLDGQPIAICLNFVQGRTLFAFKIGHSILHAKFSPGIVAEVTGVRLFLEQRTFSTGDGGNLGESYIDSYWRSRTFVSEILVSTPSILSRMFAASLPCARWLRGKVGPWTRRAPKE